MASSGTDAQVVVTTAAGNVVTVTLSDRTVYMRIPPGEKTKDKFIKISPTDFGVGDAGLRRVRLPPDVDHWSVREGLEEWSARIECEPRALDAHYALETGY